MTKARTSSRRSEVSVPAHEIIGYCLPTWETTVDRTRQGMFHRAADVDGTLFGNSVDVSILANDCLHGARPRDALGAKRLHVGVWVRQSVPVLLGESLQVSARVDNVRPDRRGRYIHIGFAFQRADGTIPVTIDHQSLILDADPSTIAVKTRMSEPESERFDALRSMQITPAMVSGYSFEFPHLRAHHDAEAAAAIGMRAPIAQGLMGFTILLQEKVRSGLADTFDVEAGFRRPIFWDDLLDIEVCRGTHFRARNQDGKTVSEILIHDWS